MDEKKDGVENLEPNNISDKSAVKTENQTGWVYASNRPKGPGVDSGEDNTNNNDISWTASEYITHNKSFAWYLVLGVLTITIAGLIYLLTKDLVSTVVVVAGGAVVGFYAAKKPRLLNYRISNKGITIQEKQFSFNSFKSFSVLENSALTSIALLPLKRFMPTLIVYLDPQSEEQVIKILSDSLPQDLHHEDFVDRFANRIRF